ncbi:hypothetical protein FRC11_002908, partial [Ceratobasidium sp. 423]
MYAINNYRLSHFPGQDTQLYNEWCAERAKTDPLFSKCYEEWSCYGELAMESYVRRKKFSWRKGLSVNYLPHQKNIHGDIDKSRRHTVFSFRDYDYTGFLADFSQWDLFWETNIDRQHKAQIEEEIGIKLGPWTVVSFVGREGIFYDFSPKVVTAILESMRARFKVLEE